ncbi:MAG TPA: peptidase M14, partial [Caldimonas sp.]|nr:peptidase M14 [Caldimonas sp.]
HLLLRTPEARAQANLVREFAPVVVVDLHEYPVMGPYLEKFNAVQRFDALLQYATTPGVPPFVTRAAEEWFRQPVVTALRAAGLSSEWYYTTTAEVSDRKVSMGGTQPDTGRNVDGLTNAVSILVETRGAGIGALHLKRRVHTHVIATSTILDSAARRAGDLEKLREFVDREVAGEACQGEVVVEAGPTPSEKQLTMIDPATGADKPVTVAWDSALELRPITVRARPCGYWLSDREEDAVRRLRALGVRVVRLDQDGELRGEEYREIGRETVQRPDVRGPIDEGVVVRTRVRVVPALLDVKAGSYYVPLDQPLANLAVAALEPDTQNSYYANGVIASASDEARVLARPLQKGTPVP